MSRGSVKRLLLASIPQLPVREREKRERKLTFKSPTRSCATLIADFFNSIGQVLTSADIAHPLSAHAKSVPLYGSCRRSHERERVMSVQRREILFVVALAIVAAMPALGQTPAPAVVAPAARNAASIPDFSGIWAHPGLGFENPLS